MPSDKTFTSGEVLDHVLGAATEVFDVPVTGSDSFFDIEGDSVHALELVGRLKMRLGVDADIEDLLEAANFASFARTIAESLTP